MKTVLLFLITLLSFEAFCCSCITSGGLNDEEYNGYDLIITGEITKIQETEWTRTIYVRIHKQFKGSCAHSIVVITCPSQSSMCGIFPKVGENWLLFANKTADEFQTNSCTRTKTLNTESPNFNQSEIENDLDYLEEQLK